jgi:hypothetical protein
MPFYGQLDLLAIHIEITTTTKSASDMVDCQIRDVARSWALGPEPSEFTDTKREDCYDNPFLQPHLNKRNRG